MPRLGLLAKSVVLLVLVFAAAAFVVHSLYLPGLERRMRDDLAAVARDVIERSREVMTAQAYHGSQRNAYRLEDLPYELVRDDADAIRRMVAESAAAAAQQSRKNILSLTEVFHERIGEDVKAKSRSLSESFRSSALKGLVALLAVLLGAAGVALWAGVLLPLKKLLGATERVAEGQLDQKVEFASRDEVGRLGKAFDRMTGALRDSREEIEALNRSLSEKVEEQTRELRERNQELTETIRELEDTRGALVHAATMSSIGRLSGGVAHEFNNLLGGIIGCAEDARQEEDPEAVRDGLDMILRTAQRACNITENLLRFSRPPARESRETDLAELVGEALELVRPEAEKRGVRIESELAPIPPVRIDPGQIHQVVLNLLTNALHATGQGGRVFVEVRRADHDAMIVVRDDGEGIPEDNLGRIFEPFFTTRGGEDPGTGLGLSVSYSIVLAHDGGIEVESRPGEGAEFRVRLPAEEMA